MENEIPDLKNFLSVWERVENKDEDAPKAPVCIIKPKEKIRASKFLPKL